MAVDYVKPADSFNPPLHGVPTLPASDPSGREGREMRRMLVMVGIIGLLVGAASPAGAAIHEQVAAYCSGGGVGAIDESGFLEPAGITDPTKKNFAQPVLSNGVVVIGASGPVVTDDPAAKFPEGSSPFALPAPDHPSTHCQALQP